MPPTGTPLAAITPQGVRDGDPAVLAALAARRGPAVIAFAEAVCEPRDVVRAAADAFARFRALVVDPEADVAVHPDALLLRCARRAALDLAPRGPDLGCGPAADLLVARAERTINARDTALLNRHLESCEHCTDISRRLDAADRAYRDADETPLEPAMVAPMVAALAAAAPLRLPDSESILPSAPIEVTTQDRTPEEAPEPEPAAEDTPSLAEEEPEEAPEPEPVAEETPEDTPSLAEEEPEEAPEPEAEEPEEAPEPGPVAEETPEDTPSLAEEEPEEAPEPEAEEPEEAPEPNEAPEPEADEPTPTPETPLGTRRVTGAPSSYYELPPLPARDRGRRAKAAARGAAVAGGAAASLTRRAGKAARKRLEKPASPTPMHEEQPADDLVEQHAARAEDTRVWSRLDSIEFPAQEPYAPDPVAAVSETDIYDPEPELAADPELQESSARAAARHYRRLRHRRQEEVAPPTGGGPPRLERPKRDRGPHLPLSAHGPRDLALPAGLVVIAVLVIMAVSGVFGGGSGTPTTGTSAKAPAEVSLVSQSASSMSLTDAERIAARAGTTTP
ncbi:MAG: hypothetical protein ACJ762_14720 [Solirubrobacteraceae bacterium]